MGELWYLVPPLSLAACLVAFCVWDDIWGKYD